MPPIDSPAVPSFRRERGPGWAAHLIDQLLDEPNRSWLRGRYAELADMTIARGGFEQANGRTLWTKRLLDTTTMTLRSVAVVLDRDGTTIITAFSR